MLHERVDGLFMAVVMFFQHVIQQIDLLEHAHQFSALAHHGDLGDTVLVHHRHHFADGITQSCHMELLIGFGSQQIAQRGLAKLCGQESKLAHPLVVVELGEVARARVGEDDHSQSISG